MADGSHTLAAASAATSTVSQRNITRFGPKTPTPTLVPPDRSLPDRKTCQVTKRFTISTIPV
jgi:hypothetical protein